MLASHARPRLVVRTNWTARGDLDDDGQAKGPHGICGFQLRGGSYCTRFARSCGTTPARALSFGAKARLSCRLQLEVGCPRSLNQLVDRTLFCAFPKTLQILRTYDPCRDPFACTLRRVVVVTVDFAARWEFQCRRSRTAQ